MKPLRIWFDPPHVRWGRVAATVLIVTVLVGLWVAQRRGFLEAAQPTSTAAQPASAPVAATRVFVAQGAAAQPASTPAAAPPAAPAASSAELVCGLGTVSFDPSDEKQIERLTDEATRKLEAHRDRVMPGWLEEMKSSADVQLQAGAWYLEAQREWVKANESGKEAHTREPLEALVALAESVRDPLPYALAFQACSMFDGDKALPACQTLRPEAWAERDAGNAVPWLMGAIRRGVDPQQRSAYIERAMAAAHVRGSWGTMHALLAKAAPPAEAPLDRSVRFFEAAATEGLLMPAPLSLFDHCREADLRVGGRRAQCERLAAFLVDRADSFMLYVFGRGIGRNLGWSKDRLDALERERVALQAAAPDMTNLAGCDGLSRAEAYFADVAKHGELGALRRRAQAAQATTTAAR